MGGSKKSYMKKILHIIFYLFLTPSVIGQTFTETDLFNYPTSISYGDDGYYFKDTQGYFNQYIGTWQYNHTSLVIQLRFVKKTFVKSAINNTYKTDVLIGGIRIVKNGQEVLNTLSSVNETKNSVIDYFIYDGPRIQNTANCTLCTVPHQRINMHYDEPHNDNNHLADMFFLMYVHQTNGGNSFLYLEFPEDAVIGDPTQYDPEIENPPTKTSVLLPFGSYTFSKIN